MMKGTIIWSNVVSRVTVPESKCVTTRFLMDSNETVWLLRMLGPQNDENGCGNRRKPRFINFLKKKKGTFNI